jgi:hypothetical protein
MICDKYRGKIPVRNVLKYEADTRVHTNMLYNKTNTWYCHENRNFVVTVLTCGIHHHQSHTVTTNWWTHANRKGYREGKLG